MIQKSAVDACRSIAALYSYDVVPPPVGGDKRVKIGTMNEKERRHEEELQARIAEYEACEGYRIRDELHAFRTGYDVFVGNYGDLKRALTRA